MDKITIELENCYGINKLNHEFDFRRKNVFAIYSPNGTMKTSFAKTLKDFSEGRESTDLIFTNRNSMRNIQKDGTELLPEEVFVIERYSEDLRTEVMSHLLVNKVLKDEYDLIHQKISEKKLLLLKKLKEYTKLREGAIESELSKTFTTDERSFHKALSRIEDEVEDDLTTAPFSDIIFKEIFNPKVLTFLNTKNFKTQIKDYISRYETLLDNSEFFKKGIFNHNNASNIASSLNKEGFFGASHSVSLNSGGEVKEVKTQKEFDEIINKAKESIFTDPVLQKSFDIIDGKLKANADLRNFREYLRNNRNILPELSNLEKFKEKLWFSYLRSEIDLFRNLQTEHKSGKERLEEIITEAKRQQTEWQKVIDIFNKRFNVPFKLSIANQDDVILKSEIPNIKFTFEDKDEAEDVAQQDLLRVLSNGEKRALYILNIIFEVESRRKNGQKTLFVVDDIADSFDYKNKYAIVEYLRDIAKEEKFYQIILSHNFDFFRTISKRLGLRRNNKLHTEKDDTEIKLKTEKYQNNPFKHWKDNLEGNNQFLIAMIPFARNIAEYTGDDETMVKLTSLLHIKEETNGLTIGNLKNILENIYHWENELNLSTPERPVLNLVFEEANQIATDEDQTVELEKKIVLSIAIRLKAEEYMIEKIANPEFVAGITSNQTWNLSKKYKEIFSENVEEYALLEQVNLMTPENIHLNSFMYEPILDMSKDALINLYERVKGLEA